MWADAWGVGHGVCWQLGAEVGMEQCGCEATHARRVERCRGREAPLRDPVVGAIVVAIEADDGCAHVPPHKPRPTSSSHLLRRTPVDSKALFRVSARRAITPLFGRRALNRCGSRKVQILKIYLVVVHATNELGDLSIKGSCTFRRHQDAGT